MKNARKIKGLQTQIKKLEADAQVITERVKTDQREVSQKMKRANDLRKQIQRLEGNGEIKVTEHAILRYLERVEGLDLKAIEEKIITDQIRELVRELGGSGEFPSNEGFLVRMKNYTIITII
jgi:predicted  nucleic acid-binding Zn-ribbon protein